MKIAIIGTGNVGNALAKGFGKSGHEIHMGSRDPGKKKSPFGFKIEGSKEAVIWSDIAVLAVPHHVSGEVISSIGPDSFRGKIVLDVTNALGPNMDLAIGCTTSAAEELAKMLPGAKVVKAFNTVFAALQSTGRLGDNKITLFVAGDDKKAKETVMHLGEEIGFDPVDAGPLKSARYIEPMAILIIKLGYELGLGPNIGYRLVRTK